MDQLGLCDWIIEACLKLRVEKPFAIQTRTIPLILDGKNVLGSAPTGQGKTAAYTLPTLHRFGEDPHQLFALVVAPTRELAFQINEQFLTYGRAAGLKTALGVGGIDYTKQKAEMFDDGTHILIGTPGRIRELSVDPATRRKFSRTKIAIFDECDKLIDPTLSRDTAAVLSCLSKTCQLLLFSATITAAKHDLLAFFKRDADFEVVDLIEEEQAKPPALQHRKIVCRELPLLHILHYLLDQKIEPFNHTTSGIIFTESVQQCEVLKSTLAQLGYTVCALHSGLSQRDRMKSLGIFKGEVAQILVATDVASRGLDIPVVDWVVNIGVPRTFESYVHRVGRCARALRSGTAVTFVIQQLYKEDAEFDRQTVTMREYEKRLGIPVEVLDVDEAKALRFSRKVTSAHIKAKAGLEHSTEIDRLVQIRKRRRKEQEQRR